MPEIQQRLTEGRLTLDLHPFVARIESPLQSVSHSLWRMYRDRNVLDESTFADFHVRVAPPSNLRRWLRPQAFFYFDGRAAFKPLPAAQAYPMLEWGLNWCIAAHSHQFLILHAAVVEMNGCAVVMPAPPGSGKSTLCAGLVSRGWRLLSDELGLLNPVTLRLHALARPVNLKNQSIAVMRAFAPTADFSPEVPHTAKGTVALMAPPADSVERMRETARPTWLVFPRYRSGCDASFRPASKAWSTWVLAQQSFNYNLHGKAGFDALTSMVDSCTCLEFEYSQLDQAVEAFAALATGDLDDGRAA
ncbi:hypothetical protein BurJ1DRAFT_3198 [Burkholderiales bacterium JOSHI_001]|nr:hypothetical protein BurJ1DRAFT_3198 [Burkholderiales bacterium JOSHI_001]